MENQSNWRDDFSIVQSHRFYNIAIFVTGLLLFLFIPLFILTPGQSKQIFNNGREIQVLLDILTLTGLFYAVIASVYWLLSVLRCREIAASLIGFLFFWVVLSGFLFPLTTNSGMFELMTSPLRTLNLVLVLLLSIGFSILWGSKYAKTVNIFVVTFLLIAIVPTIPKAFSQFEKQEGDVQQLQLSADNNLLVIGMDGVPGHLVADVFRENPSLEQEFKDFTFYENVASSSPATVASLMGIIYGNHDFTKWQEPFPIDWRELYFNNSQKYNLYTGQKYSIYNAEGTKLAAGRYGKAEQRNELFELYRYVTVRVFFNKGLNIMERIDEFQFPDREGKFYSTVKGYDTVVNSLTVGSDRPTIFYTHFIFTHWPNSVDENCAHRKSDAEWMDQNQNTQGALAGTMCGVKKYVELLDKLKSLGVYENTTIVLKSDHGKPVEYYKEPPHNLKINNNPDFGFDRHQPFLMIKPAQGENDTIKYSEKVVLLDDLAQTTCHIMETSESCEITPGLNILDSEDFAPENFYIHVVKDQLSKWYLADHKAVQLSRQVPLEQAMRESGEITLTQPESR